MLCAKPKGFQEMIQHVYFETELFVFGCYEQARDVGDAGGLSAELSERLTRLEAEVHRWQEACMLANDQERLLLLLLMRGAAVGLRPKLRPIAARRMLEHGKKQTAVAAAVAALAAAAVTSVAAAVAAALAVMPAWPRKARRAVSSDCFSAVERHSR